MTLDNIKENIEQLNAEMENLKAEYTKKVSALVAGIFKAAQAEDPRLKFITFTGYVPFFNDGDECTYSSNAGDCDLNGFEGSIHEHFEVYEDADVDIVNEARSTRWNGNMSVPNENYNPKTFEFVKKLRAILNSIDDDIWRAIGGDHAAFMIDSRGIHTETYDSHD